MTVDPRAATTRAPLLTLWASTALRCDQLMQMQLMNRQVKTLPRGQDPAIVEYN